VIDVSQDYALPFPSLHEVAATCCEPVKIPTWHALPGQNYRQAETGAVWAAHAFPSAKAEDDQVKALLAEMNLEDAMERKEPRKASRGYMRPGFIREQQDIARGQSRGTHFSSSYSKRAEREGGSGKAVPPNTNAAVIKDVRSLGDNVFYMPIDFVIGPCPPLKLHI
jgi:hypothetical protein